MISELDPAFTGPLRATFAHHDPGDARRRDSLFGLGNGVLFVRAWPPEAERDDGHYAGTYAAGCYGRRLVSHDGNDIGHDSLVNLPNWLPLSFRLGDGDWFSERCEVLEYRHTLDMRRGLAERTLLVQDAGGHRLHIAERRLVSMTRPRIAALQWEIRVDGWSGPIEIRSMIDGGVLNANTDRHVLRPYRHLRVARIETSEPLAVVAETIHAGIAVAARTIADIATARHAEASGDTATAYLAGCIEAGKPVTIEKVAAIAVGGDVGAARAEAAQAPDFAALEAEQAEAWVHLWRRVGIGADDPGLAQAIAYHSFHLLQAASPLSVGHNAGVASRGWQEAYHGHVFWDDTLLAPFLNHRFPEVARSLLMYRCRRLGEARRAARAAGHAGAMFPWRSGATGAEETPAFQFNPRSGHWMQDHTYLQRHIGAMVAHNIWHYWLITGDDAFLRDCGLEMLVEIARFWASYAQHDPADDRYDIRGVVGPDEYHTRTPGAATTGLDNNAYTNVMASAALLRAAEAVTMMAKRDAQAVIDALGVTESEVGQWRRIACRIRLCFFGDNILAQFAGFDALQPLDGADYARCHPNGRIDWELEARGDDINAYRASKQADVLTLFYFFRPEQLMTLIRGMGYAMDLAALKRTAQFYLGYVTHESSLSHVICAGALAAFDIEKSWEFFKRTLFIDWHASQSASAEEGLHLGAMAGTLDILQRHYLGLHQTHEMLYLDPHLPPSLPPTRMTITHRDQQLTVAWDGAVLHVSAARDNTDTLTVMYRDEPHLLTPGGSSACPYL